MNPKLPKGVYERLPGTKIFWIRYADQTGRIRREKAGTKGAAIQLYQKRKTEVAQRKKLPENFRAKPVSFEELADDALVYSKAHKRSWGHDESRMKRLKEWMRDRPAETLSPAQIEKWFAEQKLSPATMNRYRALLSLTYRIGNENAKLSCNPARLIRQRRENPGRIRWLLPEEEVRLRAEILKLFPHHMPELEVALNTGVRKGEQYSQAWPEIDLERRIVTIPLSKHGETRHVPLNDLAVAAYQQLHELRAGQDWVFLNQDGTRSTGPRKWFDKAVREAKLKDFTWHCLRHTFASRLVMAGVDLRTVQELMGHKTIQMTCRYAHLAPKHKLAAVQRLCDTPNVSQQDESTDTRTSTGEIATEKAATTH